MNDEIRSLLTLIGLLLLGALIGVAALVLWFNHAFDKLFNDDQNRTID